MEKKEKRMALKKINILNKDSLWRKRISPVILLQSSQFAKNKTPQMPKRRSLKFS